MKKRPVKSSTLTSLFLLEAKNPFAISGLIVIILSLTLWISLFTIRNWIQAPHERYDIRTINKVGLQKEATITSINTLEQIRIHGKSPQLISYDFTHHSQQLTHQFQTLEDHSLEVGDKVWIKVHGNQSIIEGLKPFRIPVHLFYIIPLFYLIIGIFLLLAGLRPIFKKYRMYKNGIVREATIISIYPQPVLFPHQRFWVNYSYMGISGHMFYGKSETDKINFLSDCGKTMIFVSQEDEGVSCLVPRSEALKNNWKVLG